MDHDDDAPAPRPDGSVALPVDRPVVAVPRTAVTDVALIATMAAFIAVCAVLPSITLPVMVVPITLQTFGVMLAGVLLGARRGALAVLLYLAVGLAAPLAGFLVSRARRLPARALPPAIFGAAMAGSLVFTHPIGIAVMGARLGMSAQEAITTGAVFLPGDVIKNVLVAIVAAAVFRAFPDMLERR